MFFEEFFLASFINQRYIERGWRSSKNESFTDGLMKKIKIDIFHSVTTPLPMNVELSNLLYK